MVEQALAGIGDGFRAAGATQRFAYTFYDTPHEFNLEMQEEARVWLDKWLT